MLLFLVRHGQSRFNLIGEETGSDSPLAPLGWRQAEQAGEWLRGCGPFQGFYFIPRLRARQTAEAIGRSIEAPAPIILDSLANPDSTCWNSSRSMSIPWTPSAGTAFPPVPEGYHDFRRQVEHAVETILTNALAQGHERVLVVAHGGTIGIMVRTLIGCHTISIWTMNCGVHCLGWTEGRCEIRFMNRVHFRDGIEETA